MLGLASFVLMFILIAANTRFTIIVVGRVYLTNQVHSPVTKFNG
jgi:hypothetical protein